MIDMQHKKLIIGSKNRHAAQIIDEQHKKSMIGAKNQ